MRLGGRGITHQPQTQRGKAMMLQSYALLPRLSVPDNGAFNARMKGTACADHEASATDLLKRRAHA